MCAIFALAKRVKPWHIKRNIENKSIQFPS